MACRKSIKSCSQVLLLTISLWNFVCFIAFARGFVNFTPCFLSCLTRVSKAFSGSVFLSISIVDRSTVSSCAMRSSEERDPGYLFSVGCDDCGKNASKAFSYLSMPSASRIPRFSRRTLRKRCLRRSLSRCCILLRGI